MKLVVKLPKGKPPFIGVLFEDNLIAARMNQDLILNFKNCNYQIAFEFISDKVNLRLVCEDPLIVRFYNNLEYDPVKVKNWFQHTNNSKLFNFSHIVEEYGEIKLARTFTGAKNIILKINKYSVSNEH